MKVLVTGATGFIGRKVLNQLNEEGYKIVILSRNIAKAALNLGNQIEYFQWQDTINSLPPLEAFNGVDAIIHLMGESIAEKRWSEEQKKKIYDSRIKSSANLIEAIKKVEKKPAVIVSASAVGFYGNRGAEEITEDSAPGNDFLAKVCKDWEGEVQKAQELGMRVAFIRTGMVLGREGGAMKKMLPIFKAGLGGVLGDGDQFMSWIHVDDLSRMYVEAIKDKSLTGALNGTAPYPAMNKDFTRVLGKTLKKPTFAKAPKFALKIVLGELSIVVLGGQKVIPVKFKKQGFRYKYPTLEIALKETAY